MISIFRLADMLDFTKLFREYNTSKEQDMARQRKTNAS